MFQRLVDLLKPDVSTEAKLTAVTVTVGKALEQWTGTAWQAKTLKRWNGSAWV